MFLIILLSPLVFLTCFLLPFVGTVLSREQPAKWIAFWLLQIAASWTLIPFLGLFFECEVQMLVKMLVSVALIFVLNPQLVSIVLILDQHHYCPDRQCGRHHQAAKGQRRTASLQSRQTIRHHRMISITCANYIKHSINCQE